MRYLGNKSRLAKSLAPVLMEQLTGKNWYIEPFAGAFGMISNVDYLNRIAYDKDKYIIALMKAVRDGWTPPETLTEHDYALYKRQADTLPPHEVAFAGYGCSFGGKWFGGFARGGTNGGVPRNHVAESSRNLVKMRPKLQGIKMQVCEYTEARLGEGNVVYCDPPYSTGTQYKSAFDSDKFWDWVREQSVKNYVYVSEYNAPDDFKTLWEKEHKSGIDKAATTHKATVEKLFYWDNNYSLVRRVECMKEYMEASQAIA